MNLGFESEEVEFKASTAQTSRALEALAAMLNKYGKGRVCFGVSDNGEVVGQLIGNKTMKDLSDAITTRIKPAVVPTIKFESYDGKNVIIVDVEGTNKPYSADGNYLIRSGCENKKLEPEQLRNLFFSNSVELITNVEAFNQELTFNQLKQLYVAKGLTFANTTFEKNAGLLCKNGKYNELADILSDNNNCSIKVVRFAGNDKSEMLLRNEYGYKCMIMAMNQALEYVNSLNETRVVLSGKLTREETRLFDEKCLREAWVNACLHSKWVKMVPPAIYVFNDRIEIVSTGGLPVDYSIEDFYIGISHPVNKQLQKIMGQLGIVEQTGHGVPEIVKRYGREAFEVTDNHVIVRLKFPFELASIQTDYSMLTIAQRKLLMAISNQPTITTAEMSKVTGYSISRINSLIKELKSLNRLSRVGANKSGYWQVK